MITPYLTDPVTIIKSGGYDKWKEPKDPTDKDVKGRFEFKTRLAKNLKGEEVISSATVYFSGSIDNVLGRKLNHEDMIRYNTVKYTIIQIDTPRALDDPHYEVYLA